jgi:hypothetical protein
LNECVYLLEHIEPLAFPVLIITGEAPTKNRQRSVHGPIAMGGHCRLLVLITVTSDHAWEVYISLSHLEDKTVLPLSANV